MQKGQTQDAVPNALQALEAIKEQLRERAHPWMPPPKALLAELGETRRLLGALARKQQNFTDAEQYYVHALASYEALAKLGYGADAAASHARVYQEKGDTMLDVANYSQAQYDYLKALEIGMVLVERSGATPDRSVFLAKVSERLCWNFCLLGEYQKAVEVGQQASSILNQLGLNEKVSGHISENRWEHGATGIRARYLVDRSLAHAYLLNGDDAAANKIYITYLDSMAVSAGQWRKDVQEDFKRLRNSGADDSKLRPIETLLSASHSQSQ
jgi:tetratricopeptide (TPR) repeat protein